MTTLAIWQCFSPWLVYVVSHLVALLLAMRPSERERISIFCQTLERQWGSGQWPDRQAVRRKQAPTPRKQKEEKSDLRHNFSNTSLLYIFLEEVIFWQLLTRNRRFADTSDGHFHIVITFCQDLIILTLFQKSSYIPSEKKWYLDSGHKRQNYEYKDVSSQLSQVCLYVHWEGATVQSPLILPPTERNKREQNIRLNLFLEKNIQNGTIFLIDISQYF